MDDSTSVMSHGTGTLSTMLSWCPGTMIGAAFGAKFLLARTESIFYEKRIEEDFFIAGMEWVESQGADILTASLGYNDWYSTWIDFDGNGPLSTACDLAFSRGLLIITSAGNSDIYGISAPADGKHVIAVGSVDSSRQLSSFSSRGPSADLRVKPDVMAQGSSVYFASSTNGFTTGSGTSFAAPLVAGVSALILSHHPSLTARQIRETLQHTANRFDTPNVKFGFGIVDALAAINYSPSQGLNCTDYGCLNGGICVNGTCQCPSNHLWYDFRCDLPILSCNSWCRLSVANCTLSGRCVCNNGDPLNKSGIACDLGTSPYSVPSASNALEAVAGLSFAVFGLIPIISLLLAHS